MQLSRFAITLFSIVALVLCACSKHSDDDGHEHGTKAPASTAQHGTPDAVAGSYEDWCTEHEVPESQCTRCDPALAAAFKATGDWCNEHGLPESHCVKCDSSRKSTRPQKEPR